MLHFENGDAAMFQAEDFLRQLTDKANAHQEAMQDMTGGEAAEYVKGIIDNSTLVFGVFPDAKAPNGVSFHVIKGIREVQVVDASGKADQFSTDAVPCIELEQAIAAEEMWGDGQLKSN